MGSSQGFKIHKLNQSQAFPTQPFTIDDQTKQRFQKSPNKPSESYARFYDRKPILFPKVKEVVDQYGNKSDFGQARGQQFPICQLLTMPGCFYQGQWTSGQAHGKGKIYTQGGIYFEGGYYHGLAQCQNGLLVYPDGSYYIGQFKDNEFNGKGRFYYAYNKTHYEGQWKDNQPHGKGEQKYADGAEYHGDFVKGKKQGQGVFTWPSGRMYKGQFKNGKMQGQGIIMIRGQSSHFKGKFKNGLRQSGELITEHGKYVGKFQHGEMHDDHGRFEWKATNMIYQGPFKFGKMHGAGRLINTSNPKENVVIEGEWEHGQNVHVRNMAIVGK